MLEIKDSKIVNHYKIVMESKYCKFIDCKAKIHNLKNLFLLDRPRTYYQCVQDCEKIHEKERKKINVIDRVLIDLKDFKLF